MTSPVVTFLEAQVDRLEALQYGGENAFNAVWVSPGIDVQRLLRNPTWPVVMVSNAGGRRNRQNRKLDEREFTVTLVVKHESDHVGERGEKYLLELADLVLQGDGTNPGLDYETANAVESDGDGETASLVLESGVMLLWTTLRFSYRLQRS